MIASTKEHTPKPSEYGLRILRHAAKHPLGYALIGRDPTIKKLYEQGFLDRDGFITDAGRNIVKPAGGEG